MIKFFCKECKKEIWEKMMDPDYFKFFEMHTLKEVEEHCICNDCLALKNKEVSNG